jgi:hypothetical protein
LKSTLTFFVLFFSFCFLLTENTNAQTDAATIHSAGLTTICSGTSTTIAISIGASVGPYSVVYSNVSSSFTINNYNSTEDGDDAITLSPTVTTTYSLVSVTDFYGNLLTPLNTATVTITVNPLPTNLVVTTNPVSPVCPGVDFIISATATNGSTYELWNQANTAKIGTGIMPYTLSINANTTYTIRAISSSGCRLEELLKLLLMTMKA